jgi:DUF4097 and DUF4098 domain-containing protein YvlB
MKSRSFGIACLAVMVVLETACAIDAQTYTAEGSFDRTLQVSGPVELEVRTGSGDIQVRTGPGAAVRVVGHIRVRTLSTGLSADEQVKRVQGDPPVVQTGNTIRVSQVQAPVLRDNISISYEITVPIDTRVRSRSGSGNHLVDGVRGPVEATAGSGNIRIGRAGGTVHVSTGSGDIDLQRVDGALVASAGSGSIRALAVAGAITAHTGSGEVDVVQTAGGEVDLSAGSGDIRLAGAQGPLRIHASSGNIAVDGRPAGRWELETSSGDVTVRLPADVSFDLDARSSSGRIDSRHPVAVTGTARRQLQGQVRGGGAPLHVTTASGSIRIQ